MTKRKKQKAKNFIHYVRENDHSYISTVGEMEWTMDFYVENRRLQAWLSTMSVEKRKIYLNTWVFIVNAIGAAHASAATVLPLHDEMSVADLFRYRFSVPGGTVHYVSRWDLEKANSQPFINRRWGKYDLPRRKRDFKTPSGKRLPQPTFHSCFTDGDNDDNIDYTDDDSDCGEDDTYQSRIGDYFSYRGRRYRRGKINRMA